MTDGPQLNLEIGPIKYAGRAWDKNKQALVFWWEAETEIRNVKYVSLVALRWAWPPIHFVDGFMPREGGVR